MPELKDDDRYYLDKKYCMYCDKFYKDFYEHMRECPDLQEAYEEALKNDK